jgi:hypothetical protein
MGFLLAPNYPYLRSYMANRQVTISNADPNITSHETLIGDIAYLSAIIERAGKKDAKAKKEAPPPETNNNINHLVFITPNGINFSEPLIINKNYKSFVKFFLSSVYLKIPSPPPEIIS